MRAATIEGGSASMAQRQAVAALQGGAAGAVGGADHPPSLVGTLPQRLLDRERGRPRRVGMREKSLGRWREITYGEWAAQTRLAGAGLASLGLRRGDRMLLLSENRPEWFYACVGAHGLGAIVSGVYPTNPAAELAYQIEDAGARVLVAEDQEQLDKALAVIDRCPSLEAIVVIDRRGTVGRGYTDGRIVHWGALLERGRARLDAHPGSWDAEAQLAGIDDVAVVIYTSGTTGPPKGAMLTWRNVNYAIDTYRRVHRLTSADEVLSYLPLNHVAEQVVSLYNGLGSGVTVNFAESVDTVNENLREVRPTVFFAVPRVSEKLLAGVEMRMANSTPFKRLNYRWWRRIGETLARRRLARPGHRRAFYEQPLYALSWLFLFRSIKKHNGLSRVRVALSAGAPIAPEVLFFFLSMGVPVIEGYGQTESTGFTTTSSLDDMELGAVGRPFPGVEVRLAEDGEILMRGDGVFAGYWNRPEATAETIDTDGWLHTGDVGQWSAEGHLKITDRKKDIIITAGGKNISPSEIENKLKVSPFVKEAIVIGDRRRFVSALVQIEFDTVADWAQRRGLPFTTYGDLTGKPEVEGLIADVVKKANAELARVEKVRRFRILNKELDQDDGELTATQKARRRVIVERYADVIEAMYAS